MAFRAAYALQQKVGILRIKHPALVLDDLSLESVVTPAVPNDPIEYKSFRERSQAKFFFDAGRLPSRASLEHLLSNDAKQRIIAVANDYCNGRFLYYSYHIHDLGQPTNWLLSPWRGTVHDATKHWTACPTFSPDFGDIKDVWEPSRFACAFWLTRAYALTENEQYPQSFWSLLESWSEQNPPNLGPNWKCGQEVALRTMAWCFALYGLWNSQATTPERIALMVKLLALSAARIAGNIGYAISQKNNHAISEAVGLITVAQLFPEIRKAQKYERIGRRVLEGEIRRQVYDDGSYVQHSMNYHRVMLHDCLWAIRLCSLNGRPLSGKTIDRVKKASDFLFEMTAASNGCTPNYGSNDGALILPLNSCSYTDYRPVVQSTHCLLAGSKPYASGDWDEDLMWLGGEGMLSLQENLKSRSPSQFHAGGYYTMGSENSWAMIRCHKYRDRVGHVDPLHLDLWADGVNLLRDCGSYRYYCPSQPKVAQYFKSICAHNTIVVDDMSPLRDVSRFTQLPWPTAKVNRIQTYDGKSEFEGLNLAYSHRIPSISHTRRIIHSPQTEQWDVQDVVQGSGIHRIELRWHLPPNCALVVEDSHGLIVRLSTVWYAKVCSRHQLTAQLLTGTPTGGIESIHYGEISPITTLSISVRSTMPVTLDTTLYKEHSS